MRCTQLTCSLQPSFSQRDRCWVQLKLLEKTNQVSMVMGAWASHLGKNAMHGPLLGRSRNKARLTGSCVLQLLDVLLGHQQEMGKKKAFLDSLEICGLREQSCFIQVLLLLCQGSVCSMDGQGDVSGLCSPGWASVSPKRGRCCRMRHYQSTQTVNWSELPVSQLRWSRCSLLSRA